MPVDFGKAFGSAFRYAFSVKRTLPFFFINLVLLTVLILLLSYGIEIGFTASQGIFNLSSAGVLIASVFGFVVLIFILVLIKLFFVAAVVDDAKSFGKKKRFSSSFPVAKAKYLSVVGASILVGIISFIAGSIPYAGILLAVVVSWLFLFIVPFIVIGNKSAVESLKASYNLFMNNKADVFIFWLLLGIISLILSGIIFVIILITALPILLPVYQMYMGGAMDIASLMMLVRNNLIYISMGGILASVVMAYIDVFQESAKTFFFLQKGSKRK